jgi:hypothetical protein
VSVTPAWLVDAGGLRDTLDALQIAIGSRAAVDVGALSGVVFHNRGRIAESLRLVLDAGSRVDARAMGSMGMVMDYQDPRQAARLRDLLDLLGSAWLKGLRARLGDHRIAALTAILRQPSPDLLGVLRRGRDENANSDVLRWLLDPACAPSIAEAAISGLAGFTDKPEEWRAAFRRGSSLGAMSVRRELTIGRGWAGGSDLDRIDIVISGPGFLMAIENKIAASEARSQTKTYWDWLCRSRGLRAGIFLSPAGGPADSPHFVGISYMDLVGCLLDARDPQPEESIVLAGYLRSLVTYVLRTEYRAISGGPE